MSSGIYMIKNKRNGKVYIGQTVGLARRKRNHFSSLQRNVHSNFYLQNAYNKYGEIVLDFIVLERCPPENLDKKEEEYIAKYNALDSRRGYNLVNGGSDNRYFTKDVKEKISDALSGKPKTKTHCKRISESNKGRRISLKSIKQANATKKKHKIQHGEDNPNAVISDETAKAIIEELFEGLSIKEAAQKFKCSKNTVYNLQQNRSYKHIMPQKREALKNIFKNRQKTKEEKAVQMYKQGFSQNEISKRMHISRNTIRCLLKERDINTQSHKNQHVNTEVS